MTTELFPFDSDQPAEPRRERHEEPRHGRERAGDDRAPGDEPSDEEFDAGAEEPAADEHDREDPHRREDPDRWEDLHDREDPDRREDRHDREEQHRQEEDFAASGEAADTHQVHPAEPEPAAHDQSGDGAWERYLPRLRERFPGPRDGTLFCVYKLEQDPDLTLKDFKAEAELRGIMLSGRSLHAAKVLLGMEAPPRPRRRAEPVDAELESPEPESPWEQPRPRWVAPATTTKLPAALSSLGSDLETTIRRAVDEAAHERTAKLRDAMQQAIDVLRDALDETS